MAADFDLGPDVIAQVRDAVDVVEVIGDHVRLKRRGRTWEGLCPFHEEKTPSFSVDPDKGLYYCFGCHRGGDVLSFVMQTENLSFPEAVESLARRFGVSLPAKSPGARRRHQERERYLSLLEEAQSWLVRRLASPRGAAARNELERRGFPAETWREYGFGWAPDAWRGMLDELSRRHPEGALVAAGLAVAGDGGRPPYDRFRNRITFPIRSGDGRLIAFGGRILGDGEPKYLNSPESELFHKRSTLFCLDRARRAIADRAEVLVVEGYFDCLSLHRAGIEHAVATLGTALTPEHARLLRRRLGDDGLAVLCYDADDAGRRAAVTGARVLLEAGVEVEILALPQGNDPDDVVRAGGAEAFLQMLERRMPLLDFLLAELPEDPQQRRRRGLRLAPLVCAARDPAVQRNLVEELARQLYLRPRDVVEAGRSAPARPLSQPPADTAVVARLTAGECNLVHTLVGCDPARRRRLLAAIDDGEVREPRARALLAALRTDPGDDIAVRDRLLADPDVAALLAEVNARGLPEVTTQGCDLLVRILERRRRTRELKAGTLAVSARERSGEQEETARLLAEQLRRARESHEDVD